MNDQELQAQAGAPAPATPPQEPQSKQERLQALQNELAQSQQSLEQNLAGILAKECEGDTDLEDLFYEDKQAFFEKIFALQNEKIKAELEPRMQEIDSLGQEIELDDKMQALDLAKEQFAQQNPNANPDELLQFFTQLPPDQQAQIESLPPEQVFYALQELQRGAGAAQGAPSGELPQQLSGIPSAASVNEPELDLPTQRY